MIVLPDMAMKMLMQQIVEATHYLQNVNGDPVTVGTISAANMRIAAIQAVMTVTGKTIHPADEPIVLPRVSRAWGIFKEQE